MPLKNNYALIDSEYGTVPYILPPFACGWYEYTGEYGDKTVYQFRRMPRAGRHTGKYGLWLKDKDAGMVLIGVIRNRVELVPEGTTYLVQFEKFRGLYPAKRVLTKRTCSWCGRELLDPTRLCHDSPKCRPKIPENKG